MRKMFSYFKALFLTKVPTNGNIHVFLLFCKCLKKFWYICQLSVEAFTCLYYASALFIEMYQVNLHYSKSPWINIIKVDMQWTIFSPFWSFRYIYSPFTKQWKKLWSIKYFCHIKMNNLQYICFKIVKVCWLSTCTKK